MAIIDDPSLIWFHEFKRAQEIEEFEDLNRDFDKLIDKIVRQKKFTEEDDVEFQRIVSTQYRRIISNKCSSLEKKIKNRKTRGQPFSNYLSKINKSRRESERMDTFIADFVDIIGELNGIEDSVKEKILIEKIMDIGFIVTIIGIILAIVALIL